ncbi:hypothetical protein AU468_09530 [Alkalispirochaeta sphaeroplastigenens]|uniref:Uncharacterized protein n=1 Tax=Alkalispirochaeta sphaeroplastigenens TaxID=1187066 RepID=A0A2S4JM12_9SPIO|nr:hypothetical protein AU468_09530 [Alkalispirochaeta sphaeroplastigenens]
MCYNHNLFFFKEAGKPVNIKLPRNPCFEKFCTLQGFQEFSRHDVLGLYQLKDSDCFYLNSFRNDVSKIFKRKLLVIFR